MTNALKAMPPPPRRPVIVEAEIEPKASTPAVPMPSVPPTAVSKSGAKFRQVKEDERVQFNKRVTRRVSDGYEMLAIRTRKKVPELLADALELLEERYGRVG
jgi:hypothetical protein